MFERLGESFTGNILRELDRVIKFLDDYMRYHCRYNIIETLLKAGLKIDLIGQGCEMFAEKYPAQISVHGGKDVSDTVAIMSRAKIIINAFFPYEMGTHERIITAMLNNAACFSPKNPYLEQEFGNKIELIDLLDLPKMTEKIHYILDNFDEYKVNVLDNNKIWALNGHTWENRGEQIIDFYEKVICNMK